MNIEALTPIQQVMMIEDIIKAQPQTPIETRHYFAGGVYEREIHVPAGTLMTGKIHLTEHLAKLVKGRLRIWGHYESGIFEGPHTFVSKPGAKRVGYAETDVVFSTFHHVGEERSIEAIEEALVVDTIEQFLMYSDSREALESKCL